MARGRILRLMELLAPRLNRVYGFSKPVFHQDVVELTATLIRNDCLLRIVNEGESMWVYLDFKSGPRDRVNLTVHVARFLGRTMSPAESGANLVPFKDIVLAWDELLASYFTYVKWTQDYFPPEWMHEISLD